MDVVVLLKRLFTSDHNLVQGYVQRGRPDLAWKVLSLQALEELRRDPTSTYTVNWAERDLQRSRLALDAKAYEWAWVGATDCLAVLEWKGQLETDTGADAKRLLELAENNLPPERIDDLLKKHSNTAQQHNSLDQLRFKERLKQDKLWLWKRVLPGIRLPDLAERPY